MFTRSFWLAAAERAIRTFAGALVAFLAANATGVLEVDWVQALSVSGLATIIAVLTSIAAAKIGPEGPSFGSEAIAHHNTDLAQGHDITNIEPEDGNDLPIDVEDTL